MRLASLTRLAGLVPEEPLHVVREEAALKELKGTADCMRKRGMATWELVRPIIQAAQGTRPHENVAYSKCLEG